MWLRHGTSWSDVDWSSLVADAVIFNHWWPMMAHSLTSFFDPALSHHWENEFMYPDLDFTVNYSRRPVLANYFIV